MLNTTAILKRAGKLYADAKYPVIVDSIIQSDQVRALCLAMCEAINAEAFKQPVTVAVDSGQIYTTQGLIDRTLNPNKPAIQPFPPARPGDSPYENLRNVGQDLNALIDQLRCIQRQNIQFPDYGGQREEFFDNVTLARRHIEDARARLDKSIGAILNSTTR